MKKQTGFTLIELAIVLVIIGLILGAILKGQDLMINARGKKFANWVKGWQTLQLTHLDRKGRYAGRSPARPLRWRHVRDGRRQRHH